MPPDKDYIGVAERDVSDSGDRWRKGHMGGICASIPVFHLWGYEPFLERVAV